MLLILLPFLFTSASGEVYGPFLLFQSYIFLVMYNALLVYADLVSRHLIAVPTCPMCHSQSETLYICFSEVFLLKFCSELYDLLVYQVISLFVVGFSNFLQQWNQLLAHSQASDVESHFYLISYFYWLSHYSIFGKLLSHFLFLLAVTLQHIWKSRNRCVFNNCEDIGRVTASNNPIGIEARHRNRKIQVCDLPLLLRPFIRHLKSQTNPPFGNLKLKIL